TAVGVQGRAEIRSDGLAKQLIEEGIRHRIVDFLEAKLAVLRIEYSRGPVQTRRWIDRLHPEFLGVVDLLVGDAGRRTVILQSRRKMDAVAVEQREVRRSRRRGT